MRRILISLLLASAAASPAVARPHNSDHQQQQQSNDDRQSARDERQAAREDRQQARQESRNDRSNNRPQYEGQAQNAPQVQVRQQAFSGGGERNNARPDRGDAGQFQGNRGVRVVNAPSYQDRQQLREQRIQARDVRQAEVRNVRELRQSNRMTPNVMRTRNPLVVSNTPRPGTQPPLRADNYRRGGDVHWNTNWRHNGRYDWHGYRNHHRRLFHLGFYYDPYGWGYQPFSIGWRLWPNYYSSNYWINDPWMYRLPYAPPGYVWVRYWNDAILVDRWSGTVVDVIPGFFW